MRNRADIEQVLQEVMAEPADGQRALLVKRLTTDELLVADDLMADLRASYGHAEHPDSGGLQCRSCGSLVGSNQAALWVFHPRELLRVAD